MASDKTGIGDRMKGQYEDRARFMLPRRTYTIVRVDGKAFHSFTRGMERPFDLGLMVVMDKTAQFMCGEIHQEAMCVYERDLPWWEKEGQLTALHNERSRIEAELSRDTRSLSEKEATGQLTLANMQSQDRSEK